MRAGIAIPAIAAVALTLTAPAGADDVAAYGRLVDGVCVFAEEVRVPAGHSARADDGCRLVIEPIRDAATGEAALPAGTATMPKRATAEPAVTAGLAAAPTVPTAVVGLAGTATSRYRLKIGFARMVVTDEYSRRMYDDEMSYTFERRDSDGALRAAAPYEAACVTGNAPDVWNPDLEDPTRVLRDAAGTAPYYPYVRDCYANLLAATSRTIVFESGGWYGTTLGIAGVGVRYDYRHMVARWVTDRTGFRRDLSYCLGDDELPRDWKHDCILGESDFEL